MSGLANLWIVGLEGGVVHLVQADLFRQVRLADVPADTPSILRTAISCWDTAHGAAGENVHAAALAMARRNVTVEDFDTAVRALAREEWCVRVVEVIDWMYRGTPPLSPFRLHQEAYRWNPWRMLCGCILCAGTRGSTAWEVSRELLARWPTPGALVEADSEEVETLIRPAGWQSVKAVRLREMSSDVAFAGNDAVRLDGVGDYAEDSLRAFHRGDASTVASDPWVHRYIEWLRETRR